MQVVVSLNRLPPYDFELNNEPFNDRTRHTKPDERQQRANKGSNTNSNNLHADEWQKKWDKYTYILFVTKDSIFQVIFEI